MAEREFDLDSNDGEFGFEDANHAAPRAASFEHRLNAAKAEIKDSDKARFAHDSGVEEFLHQYDDIAANSVAKLGGNLLHALVEVVKYNSDRVKPDGVELLIRRIVRRWPDHLQEINKDGHNPLFMAIRNTLPELVDYMVSACENKGCLDNALSHKAGQGGNTCLHVVFKENFNPNTTRRLIESASDDALAVRNDFGKTPMHYAVSFKQCTDARRELIALFIDRDNKARQKHTQPDQTTFLDLHADNGWSVYREHEQTREPVVKRWKDFLASERQKAETKQTQAARLAPRELRDKARDPLRQVGSAELNGDRNTDEDGGLDDREKKRQIQRKAEEEAKKKAEEEAKRKAADESKRKAEETKTLATGEINDTLSVSGQPTVRTGMAGRSHEPAPNTPLKRRGTTTFDNVPKHEREKQREPARPAPNSRGTSNAEMMPKLLTNSDAILMGLKLHYMRTRTAERIISFLYGNNLDGKRYTW
jgi:hypothetical protein